MAAKKNAFENKEKYSKLVIYKNKLFTLLFAIFVFFIILTTIMFSESLLQHHWLTVSVPVTIIGSFLTLYPPTEEWEYKPWQSQAEKREQTFFN